MIEMPPEKWYCSWNILALMNSCVCDIPLASEHHKCLHTRDSEAKVLLAKIVGDEFFLFLMRSLPL